MTGRNARYSVTLPFGLSREGRPTHGGTPSGRLAKAPSRTRAQSTSPQQATVRNDRIALRRSAGRRLTECFL